MLIHFNEVVEFLVSEILPLFTCVSDNFAVCNNTWQHARFYTFSKILKITNTSISFMKKHFLLLMMFFMFALTGFAQAMKVSGTVTSAEDGLPLPGVAVVVKENPTVGVATDIDGKYTITAEKGQTLVFSYVGCKAQNVKVGNSPAVDIELEAEANVLQEVVAVGYGTMKKSDLTGSVTSISADKLTKTPAASLANALQGQAAGVTVNNSSGQPGGAPEVRIRGVGTVNGASPIYVVDGVIVDDISFLSPQDIESTEILKDASATAIYGSRGANGVIIVTTRGGKLNQKTRVTLDAYVGVQQRWRTLDVMNAKEFADTRIGMFGSSKSSRNYYKENGLNAWLSTFGGINNQYFPTVYNPETNPTGFNYEAQDTDWQDVVFQDALIQNYHLSIDGGSDKTTYSLSGSWYSQEGTIIGSDYQRFTVRLNTSHKVNNWLKVGENVSFMASTARNAMNNAESAGASVLSAAFAMAPWDPVRYPEGSVNRNGDDLSNRIASGSNKKEVTNPLSMVEHSHPKNRNERFIGNVFAEITPLEGLTFRSTYSFDYNIATNKEYKDAHDYSTMDQLTQNFLSSSMARTYNWTVDNILTYARTIGKHDFSIMVGQTTEEYNYYSIGGSGSAILNPVEKNWYLSQTTDNKLPASDGVSRNRRISALGRVHYSFDNRYLITVNFRADGSSKFPDNPWGYFPSTALAWKINEEDFMKDFHNLDLLKIRAGWGRVGNDNIGNNAFLLEMRNNGPTFLDYVFGADQQLANGATVLTWINNGGHWENTEQWSLGVDFGLWKGKLNGNVDFFIRNTKDMLMSVTAPAQVGNRFAATSNVGTVRNRGIEIQLEHRNNIGDVYYSIGGNVSFIDNELTGLNGGSPIYSGYDNLVAVDQGFPLYYFWGYQYEGIYRSDEEVLQYLPGYTSATTPFHAGDAKYKDVNGDGKIDDNDRTKLGSSIPWLNYGINLGLEWKNFDVQIFFQGVAGNKIYNQLRHRLEGDGSESILSPKMANAWTSENPNGDIPNPRNSVNYYVSDRFLENGSYFRLKNMQIGYTIPTKAIRKIGLEHCRVYLQGSNLLTATKYTGFDPEVGGQIDYGNYPQARSFIVGANLSF